MPTQIVVASAVPGISDHMDVNKDNARGAFKYYIIKEMGGWVGQMMMFDDKVGGWGWLNDDLSKKYP